jgi:hypothetical protein
MILTEDYLKDLYTTYEQEIRGDNKPIEDVDHRPNYIGMCINMMETPQMKINCLRKVKEMTAMNPFYQYRIDRFVDAITNTWEPTNKPGFNEYIRGDKDTIQESVQPTDIFEGGTLDEYLNYVQEIDPITTGIAVGGGITAANLTVMGALKRKKCRQAFPNNQPRYKQCVAGVRHDEIR